MWLEEIKIGAHLKINYCFYSIKISLRVAVLEKLRYVVKASLIGGIWKVVIAVDIADRQYDYTDEEKAAEAIAFFQMEKGLKDEDVLAVWADEKSSNRVELERRIFDAVDANGTAKRAEETIPGGITLSVAGDTA